MKLLYNIVVLVAVWLQFEINMNLITYFYYYPKTLTPFKIVLRIKPVPIFSTDCFFEVYVTLCYPFISVFSTALRFKENNSHPENVCKIKSNMVFIWLLHETLLFTEQILKMRPIGCCEPGSLSLASTVSAFSFIYIFFCFIFWSMGQVHSNVLWCVKCFVRLKCLWRMHEFVASW